MTTFSLVDNNTTILSSNTSGYSYNNSLYTVPTGKIARIQFDSCHMRVDGGGEMQQTAWGVWSKPDAVVRKHYMASYYGNGTSNYLKTVHWYPNGSNHSPFTTQAGYGASTRYFFTASAQMEDWVSSSGAVTGNDGVYVGHKSDEGSEGYGSQLWGPDSFYCKAGEQLLFTAYSSVSSTSTVYMNLRLAVWLEDE